MYRSIFDFIMPYYLLTYSRFVKQYERQILKFHDAQALQGLNRRIRPFVMRRMKKDVLKALLEEEYAKKRPEFLHFVECYATGKNDEVLEELILKLYEFSVSDPFPEEWLERLTLNQGVQIDEKSLDTPSPTTAPPTIRSRSSIPHLSR